MKSLDEKPQLWPLSTPEPNGRRARVAARAARVVAWALLATALVVPVVQFQAATQENVEKARQWDRKHGDPAEKDGEFVGNAGKIDKLRRPNPLDKGAIARWSKAVGPFWDGENIYREKPDPNAESVEVSDSKGRVWLHPNMPFVVILLTPFAMLPIPAMALAWNILKLLVLAGTFAALARLASRRHKLLPDWVLGLGVLWAPLVIGDIQHGNTNVFVLGAVVWHLWWYRRGRDWLAGGPLALAICLKMTPAIFLLYWAWQRNWKLLGGTMIALVLFAAVVPSVLVGPAHYVELTTAWLDNLIVPGLIEGESYPIHINQSLSGVLSRYFIGEPNRYGDIYWNPDDNPYSQQEIHGWIAFASLSPTAVKWVLRAGQLAVVLLVGWAIGRRKLPRTDPRRALHYGLVALAWLILNQRTWDHHATVLLIATVPFWYAIAYGRMSRARRAWALGLMLLGGVVLLAGRGEALEGIAKLTGREGEAAKLYADRLLAYGPTFWSFVLHLATGVLLAVTLRPLAEPYADRRQKLFADNA